jgi:hypothetical protein
VNGSYSAEISRKNPTCIMFLLDQSYSMNDAFAGEAGSRKADAAAEAINDLLLRLILRCTKGVGEPRNYFDVGVIGYGAARGFGPSLGGALKGSALVSISKLADNPLRVEKRMEKKSDGSGGQVEVPRKFPVWFDPVAEANTPMAEAMQYAHKVLKRWVAENTQSFPPLVINITDGMPNADPTAAAGALTGLSVNDGNILLYNLHLSSLPQEPILFPAESSGLPDEFARMLFGISSVFPEKIRQEFENDGYRLDRSARGFVFNSNPEAMIRFLDIGTRQFKPKESAGDS